MSSIHRPLHCRPRRQPRYRWQALAALCALNLVGCGREFFRNWADQDVTEAVFEKSRDPRWRIDLFSIEPPSMSRFADPYDPDRPPAPPDDPAAEALSPVPQWPHHRLLVPAEGTGYLAMLDRWQRDRPYVTEEENEDQVESVPPAPPRPESPPPAPSTDSRPPFQPDSPPPPPTPDADSTAPGLDSVDVNLHSGIPRARQNSGVPGLGMTPKPVRQGPPTTHPSSIPGSTSVASTSQAPATRRDPGVQLSAFQTTEAAQTTTPGGAAATPRQQPGEQPLSRPVEAAPGDAPTPIGDDPLRGAPALPLDPDPIDIDLTAPFAAGEGESEGLSGLLSPPPIEFSHTEAAGLPSNSNPYIITPVQALTLALINSRSYQTQIEAVYQSALSVTLARWNLTPQFNAGLSPGGVAGGSFPSNFANSFLYRTAEAQGGQSSILNIGTAAGFGKALSFGGRLIMNFANQVVFNFTGANPVQPTVQSILPLSYVQPFLRGGGRAVTLEPLTLAERQLLYDIRSFARFRQTFFPSVLTAGAGAVAFGGGGGAADPTIGYLSVLQQLQVVENSRKTVAAFEQLLKGYQEMAQGGGSGVSSLNVDQIDLNLQQQRLSLLQASIAYQNSLDRYKLQLGLPPDVPIVLDRGLTKQFRDVFNRIDDWFKNEDREPSELPSYVRELPTFPDTFLDGRPVLAMGIDAERREDVLLAAERIALENRFDLMNQRAQLYDAWRQLAVRANALKGVFNVSVTNQVFTPPTTTNPFAFSDQAKQFNLTLNAELPLVRLAERNTYRLGVILYRQQQRALMAAEDQVKLAVRVDIRQLLQLAEQYEIQERQLIISLQQKDNTQRQIFAPPGPGDTGGSQQVTANTQALIQAQNTLLTSQNQLISTWVNYVTQRIQLYSDLGIIPYDEWEAYYELFPTESTRPATRAAAGRAGAAPAPAADAPARAA